MKIKKKEFLFFYSEDSSNRLFRNKEIKKKDGYY